MGVDAKGQPIPNPAKEPKVNGSMIDMPAMGATNWPPPSYDPQTELFYFNGTRVTASPICTTLPTNRRDMAEAAGAISIRGSALFAMDMRTGSVKWKHEHGREGGGGMSGGVLTTAGKLVFTGDSGESGGVRSRRRASLCGISG